MENCVPKTKMIGVRDLTILITSKRGVASMHVYQLIKYFWRFLVKKKSKPFFYFPTQNFGIWKKICWHSMDLNSN